MAWRVGRIVLCIVVALLIVATPAECAGVKRGPKGGTADRELRSRRSECEKNACQGLQDPEKQECTYKCISEDCWGEVYSKDHIEEGEVDTERSRQFSICFRKAYKKELDAKREQDRRDKHEAAEKSKAL